MYITFLPRSTSFWLNAFVSPCFGTIPVQALGSFQSSSRDTTILFKLACSNVFSVPNMDLDLFPCLMIEVLVMGTEIVVDFKFDLFEKQ